MAPHKPEMPDRGARGSALQISRRSLLGFVAAVPLLSSLVAREAGEREAGRDLVMREGWVLRAGDLKRVALA